MHTCIYTHTYIFTHMFLQVINICREYIYIYITFTFISLTLSTFSQEFPILYFLPLKNLERLFMLKMIYIKIHTLAFLFVCYIFSHILIFSLSPLWTTYA